jgi:ADP-L-glycero-D-manno-heptose 6-epimerase
MILVTGGAGFIGSNFCSALNGAGADIIMVDSLGTGEKWRNIASRPPLRLLHPSQLDSYLATNPSLGAVVHLGAISETTATDGDLVWHTNVTLSQKLWSWCAENDTRFIYASSAATYGDGSAGFDDECSLKALRRLKPMNLYGFSKHAFDLWAATQVESGAATPPAWAGVKFFNVFGPNEYHKGPMISVVKVKQDEIAAGGPATLFRSDQPGLADGEQKRDFIYIDDVTAALMFMLTAPSLGGIFNLGTGQARSYLDLAKAVCAANKVPERITFIDMPDSLRGQYQSFTEAPMRRLRSAGFRHPFTSLEDGVTAYIQNFLAGGVKYR